MLNDDYEKCEILGYLSVYVDGSYTEVADTVFLVEADGCVDMHTLYNLDGKHENRLNVKDVQVDKLYEYENVFFKEDRGCFDRKRSVISPKIHCIIIKSTDIISA